MKTIHRISFWILLLCSLNAVASENQFLNEARELCGKAENSSSFLQKRDFAKAAYKASSSCLKNNSKDVGCLYYRAVSQGLLVEAKSSSIKKGLQKMIRDFETVIQLDSSYDDGGAYLALGTLYLKLPVLPIIDDELRRDLIKAADYSLKALQISADNPDNLKLAGLVALKQNRNTEALDYLKKALQKSASRWNDKKRAEVEKEIHKTQKSLNKQDKLSKK